MYVSDIPELITLRTASRKKFHVDTVLFTQCIASWDDDAERHYTTSKIVFLYLLPLTITSAAYFQIVRVLWKSDNIPGHRYQREVCFISGSAVDSSRRYVAISGGPSAGTQAQLRSRRKAAKMLVCVVLMFALCYFPVHLLSILRYTVDIPQNDITVALSMLSHWLCYANSATNPLIYNFMSGKYRKEFRKTLTCCFIGKNDRICARSELTCRDCRLTQITSARTDTAHFGAATTSFDLD
ncbi:hypothetical protein O3M35_005566 [Rhynocoris fuscipes]|uniref:G-protein coupled receptors family 1 profile domain-containing protein n=1 Tax=Rhynocoris fuscipes TaxID=488301 RepID=A0AAW1DKZ1_9HEMI